MKSKTTICIFILFLACKNEKPAETMEATADLNTISYTAVYNYLLKHGGIVRSPPKQEVEKLKFHFIGAGLQTNEYGEYVRLFFNASTNRDYIEILRCTTAGEYNDSSDGGGFDLEETQNVLKGDLNTVNEEGIKNRWNKYLENAGCTKIGSNKITSAEHYIDLTATPADNEVFYVARACVDRHRIDEKASIYADCSNQVAISNPIILKNYSHEEEQMALLQELERISNKLKWMTERAFELSNRMVEEANTCAVDALKRQHAKEVREAVSMLAGISAGVGASLFTFGLSAQGMIAGANAGKALGSAFSDIFTSAEHYPRSVCPPLEEAFAEFSTIFMATEEDVTINVIGGAGGSIGKAYDLLLSDYNDKLKELTKIQNSILAATQDALQKASEETSG